jgi:arylformamidase
MKIIDISVGIKSGLPVWPGDPPVQVLRVKSMLEGYSNNVSNLQMSAHTGTHVDAPVHFLKKGKGVDFLKLSVLMGPAYLVYLPKIDVITASDLAKANIPSGTKRLLIKTRNSGYWRMKNKSFQKTFVGLVKDAALWIVEQGIHLVGIDYLSIAPYKQGTDTHVTLLKDGIVIVEGLNLSPVKPGIYEFICLPLKITGCDGAPARAVLIEGKK